MSKYRDNINEIEICNIVALTSYTSSDVIQKCQQIGIKSVYSKPIDFAKLSEVINKYFYTNT